MIERVANGGASQFKHLPHGGQAYRGDIDGLRAVAVLSVILFHADMPLITGGYAGVDVFFVISGYLITGGIRRDLSCQSFDIFGFYERRVRRIYPALLALLAAVMAVGAIVLMPDELKDLGAEAAAAVGFSSNLLFWWQTDYFATAAELKPLLHTWSLAVEEQFYLVIAPLMAFASRRWRHRAGRVLIALGELSFASSCASAWIDPSGNYYLPHNRAWELLLGSIVAVYKIPIPRRQVSSELVALAGLAMIVLPMFLLDRDSVFPAWNAVPTCLGTAILISIGETTRTSVAHALSVAPMRWVGLLSYSLYLVHWPVLVFARYLLLGDPTAAEMVGLIAIIFAIAWLSWRFVELPFRRRTVPRRRLLTEAAAASGALAAIGVALFAMNGLPGRFGPLKAPVADAQVRQTKGCFLKGSWREWRGEQCFLTNGPGPTTLLWGNSHANHYAPALQSEAHKYRERVILYASAGCPPVLGLTAGRPDCLRNNEHALTILKQFGVSRVIMSAAWQYDFERSSGGLEKLAATVALLRRAGIQVAIIGDSPAYPFSNPQYLGQRLAQRIRPGEPYYTAATNQFAINGAIRRAARPDEFFDPLAAMCQGDRCLAFNDEKSTMRDGGHFSTYGAKLALSRMGPVFR